MNNPFRLGSQSKEIIDRSRSVEFSFDGKTYSAYQGDTIASALAAAGVRIFSRSFKYHRPRGLYCCGGYCPNCLVQVGNEPNVRACQRVVESGMKVDHLNASPSLQFDFMSLTQFFSRLLPVGFYYKTFLWPKSFWSLYEWVLRHAAGLGKVAPKLQCDERSKQNLNTDVAIIGGGPAGIQAALAAAQQNASVLLFDMNPGLGGHLRFTSASAELPGLLRELEQQKNIQTHTETTVVGWYQGNLLAAVRGSRLYHIRAHSIIVATGAYETPLVFDNNDLPGVMLASAAQRLVDLYGVMPGQRAVIITSNDDGWQAAEDLRTAGISIAAIVDERVKNSCTSPHLEKLSASVPVFWEHTIVRAVGTNAVNKAIIAKVGARSGLDEASKRTIACDLVALSVGWTPASELIHHAGGKYAFDSSRAGFLPATMPPGVFAAGRVTGTSMLQNQLAEGRDTGASAAMYARTGDKLEAAQKAVEQRRAAEPRSNSSRVTVPGNGKRFVCFCEDVSDHDIETAIAEGFDSSELLKRYSTISMGPCQGKLCSANTSQLCARVNRRSVTETGATTMRPPIAPVPLGTLAGPPMNITQYTPAHDWHVANGGKMILAGTWARADHYGDPEAEMRAIRERVALIDVSTLGKIKLTGVGIPSLLDHIYINQWHNLGIGRVRYGAICNDEGVVLDDGVCAHVGENEWYMSASTTNAMAIFEWIQWWTQTGGFDNVHAIDVTDAFTAFNLAGPQSRAVLAKLTDADVSNAAFPYMNVRDILIAGVPSRVQRIGFTGELSYEIHSPSNYGMHVWQALQDAGKEFGMLAYGVEGLRISRLEKGHILVGYDTDALSDPISLGLAWAVKLEKPDFVGKRSIARISAEGPRQRLVGFKMITPNITPDEGLQIVRRTSDKPEILGYITSSRYSAAVSEAIGLCWLPREIAEQDGAQITIRLANGTGWAQARVHHGAFYDPDGNKLRS